MLLKLGSGSNGACVATVVLVDARHVGHVLLYKQNKENSSKKRLIIKLLRLLNSDIVIFLKSSFFEGSLAKISSKNGSGILSAFSGIFCSQILRFGNFRVATSHAKHVQAQANLFGYSELCLVLREVSFWLANFHCYTYP